MSFILSNANSNCKVLSLKIDWETILLKLVFKFVEATTKSINNANIEYIKFLKENPNLNIKDRATPIITTLEPVDMDTMKNNISKK